MRSEAGRRSSQSVTRKEDPRLRKQSREMAQLVRQGIGEEGEDRGLE